MKKVKPLLFVCALLSLQAYAITQPKSSLNNITLTKSQLMDKIKGGWAGKTIGCTYGGPVEFKYNGMFIQDYIPMSWDNQSIKWYFDHAPGLYDDLYVNLSFVDVIERLGYKAPADSFATAFANASFPLWHANQSARYNVLNGIMPPASGYWENNPHADDIDFQIEADFAGIMSPGMPNTSSQICDKVGHIMNYGNGWYGGVYVAALYSMAYMSNDVNSMVSQALKTIPAKSKFYQCISDIIKWHKQYPNDWKQTWFECQKKWSTDIGCPEGVFEPYDIDALINSAYVTIGLLYGHGDFGESVRISTRCGQDADCNPSTVAGILGTMIGYSHIPDYWKNPLQGVEDRPFSHVTYSLNKAYAVSFRHALMMIKEEGGKVNDNNVVLKCQQPVPVRFEESFVGHFPINRIQLNHNVKGEENFTFNGIGIVVRGEIKSKNSNYVGQIAVTLDGKDKGVINMPAAYRTRRNDIYWIYKLANSNHKISFRWLNSSDDVQLYFREAIIYGSTMK